MATYAAGGGSLKRLFFMSAAKPRRSSIWDRALSVVRTWQQKLPGAAPEIPAALWQDVLHTLPFLLRYTPSEQARLRQLCAGFLAQKEFHGTQGLVITDPMALLIAAQACVPLLHWGPDALRWYGDFVGIVIHPHEVVARRKVTDAAGVVHSYEETLLGEAMAGGPVMLVWSEVSGSSSLRRSGQSGGIEARGHNLVIHEFAHKLDMFGKALGDEPDGCPPLPAGFMGLPASSAARLWHDTLNAEYQRFVRQVEMADRFGGTEPWLDRYGAYSPAEFFAVACEAYFVSRERLGEEFPELLRLFNAFFEPPRP